MVDFHIKKLILWRQVQDLVVNRTFGSVQHQPCYRTVRFGSADFFRLSLNSSVRFAEQFSKILAEQFGRKTKLGTFGLFRFGAKNPSSVHH